MNCARCAAPLAPGSLFCSKCGLGFGQPVPDPAALAAAKPGQPAPYGWLDQPPRSLAAAPSMGGSSALRIFGCLILLGGLALAGYFFFAFDTSVAVPPTDFMGGEIGGGRVNNIGLMADRQNGIVIGMGASILGAILMYAGRSR